MICSGNVIRISLVLASVAAVATGFSLQWSVNAESAMVESALLESVIEEPKATYVSLQKKDDEPALRSFMRQKLEASNRILEGLVTDDLSMVEAGSETLLKMSKEAKWRASNDALYRRYSTEFVDAVSDMQDKARSQSIDGTSLAWIKSTMTCLKCHEWVRNTIIADAGK